MALEEPKLHKYFNLWSEASQVRTVLLLSILDIWPRLNRITDSKNNLDGRGAMEVSSPTPCSRASSRARSGCSWPCPGNTWTCPRRKTSQTLRTPVQMLNHLCEKKWFFLYGQSEFSLMQMLWLFHCAPLRGLWPCCLCCPPIVSWNHQLDPPLSSSSPGWTNLTPSASSWTSRARLELVVISCVENGSSGQSVPDVASYVPDKGE